jgi:hypothetical protein
MLVISPHLDDAVLSCRRWLAARPDSCRQTLTGLPRALRRRNVLPPRVHEDRYRRVYEARR